MKVTTHGLISLVAGVILIKYVLPPQAIPATMSSATLIYGLAVPLLVFLFGRSIASLAVGDATSLAGGLAVSCVLGAAMHPYVYDALTGSPILNMPEGLNPSLGYPFSSLLQIVLWLYYIHQAGRFPDIDLTRREAAAYKAGKLNYGKAMHRVLFHNFAMMTTTSLAIAFLASLRVGDEWVAPLCFAWVAGYGLHLAADCATKWGCALAWPFSRRHAIRDLLERDARIWLIKTGGWREKAFNLGLLATFTVLLLQTSSIQDAIRLILYAYRFS